MATNNQSFFEDTQDLVEQYLSNRVKLLKLQAVEKTSRLATLLFTGIVIGLLGFFALLFISLLAAILLSEQLHSFIYGFGLIALFYLVLLVVLMLCRPSLGRFFFHKMASLLFESNQDDEPQSPNSHP